MSARDAVQIEDSRAVGRLYVGTGTALKHDASKTDYIILPLMAGVIASCSLGVEAHRLAGTPYQRIWPVWQEMSRELLAACARENDAQWKVRPELYELVASVAGHGWHAALCWVQDAWAFTAAGLEPQVSEAARLERIVRWLHDDEDRTLTECGLMTCYAMVLCAHGTNSTPLLDRAMRPLRVELAHRLFRERLTSWPEIVRAVHAEWNVDLVQRMLFEYVESYSYLTRVLMPESLLKGKAGEIERLERRVERLQDELSAAQASAEASAMALAKASAGEVHDVDLASRVESLESEVARLEEERRRLEREVVVRSERHAGADSHAAALERELGEANERNQRLEAELVELRRERDQASEDTAADLALAPDAEDASSVSRVPNDSFAGRRVLLFTGHAVASTREAMRESFFEVGAMQVDCYWTDKARGPETFPEEAIVVIDVTFMSHSDSASIQARAARTGAWCLVCRRGASLIGREAVARWLARRVIARSGSSES